MRIVYVSTRSDAVGGSNVHIRDLARAMQSLGHEVLVLGGGNGVFADDLRSHGVPYEPLRHLIRAIRPWRDVAAVIELRRALSRIRPDLLSLHTAKAGAVGRLAAWGSGTPVLYTPHGWTFTPGVPPREAAVYAAVERLLAPLTMRFVNVCAFEGAVASERRIGPVARHVVVHNGMPVVSSDLHASPAMEPPVLVMVARFEAPKEHAALLRALATCRDLPWRVELVGNGPLEGSARALVAELGLADRVTFLGARHDVADVLARAQAFALVTRWEGFPRSILEAMRAGLPVIASDVGGVHEAVDDGVTGFVVPPGDAGALARAVRTLLGDAALRSRMGELGRARFAARFTFETMLRATLLVYDDLLASDTR